MSTLKELRLAQQLWRKIKLSEAEELNFL